jgi:hypothetical protein
MAEFEVQIAEPTGAQFNVLVDAADEGSARVAASDAFEATHGRQPAGLSIFITSCMTMFRVEIAEDGGQTDAPPARRLTWTGASVDDRDAEACAVKAWTERHGSPPREPFTISARRSTEPSPLELRLATKPPEH